MSDRVVRRQPTHVVGLGGSAGGLDAFTQFLTATAADTGMAFVIVSHLDPDHKTLLVELLQRATAMTVRTVVDGTRIQANTVFVIPPNRELALEGDALRLRTQRRQLPRSPIDAFFRSLAHERGPTSIGVVVSGTGSDGAAGLLAIAEAGGATLVEDPASAGFDAMPRAAIAAVPGAIVAAVAALPARIAELAPRADLIVKAPPTSAPDKPAIERVLEILRRRTGHDLSLYKHSTIARRLERRLAVHHLDTVEAYAAHLESSPDEAELLLRELLIGVTEFFRDADAFDVLRDVALPALIAARGEQRQLRAWVGGCSTGEEAYSLAIIMHELLVKSGAVDLSMRIYATDIDANAISVARAGHYSANIAEQVSAERLARYFRPEENGFRIRKEIRESLVFAQHDLTTDPPFTRLDIVCCRNVLIYLQPTLQHRLLARFHHALVPDGVLVLGASESVSSAPGLFSQLDPKANVFRRLDAVRGAGSRVELPDIKRASTTPTTSMQGGGDLGDAARRMIAEEVAPPTVVINDRGDILYTSRRAGRYLEPPVGKTNINIFSMAREGLALHLSQAVRQAITKQRRIAVKGVVVRGERGRYLVDVAVVPMADQSSLRGLLMVVFEDSPKRAEPPRRAGAKAPAAGGREIERVKAHLQTVVRDMEESQAQIEVANEELQSTNEELQSTNEELTTSTEELQSMNEELVSLNAELEDKNGQLVTANDDLRNLLNSTKIPTLFLDRALRVKRFTSEATRVTSLIPGDVGRALTDINLKVDYPGLARDVEEVLDTLAVKEVQVAGTDGASFTVRIHPYRTMDNVIDGVVVTFSDVTMLRRAELELAARAQDSVIARLLDRWPGMVYIRDLVAERDVYLNEAAHDRLMMTGDPEASFESLVHPDDRVEGSRARDRVSALRDSEVITRNVRIRGPANRYDSYRARESVLARSTAGVPVRILAVVEVAE